MGAENLLVMLRPGNAGADTAADHITAARRALASLPGAGKGGRWTRRILFRTDTGGKAKDLINYLHDRNVGFAVNSSIGELVSTLPDQRKHPVILSDDDRKAAIQRDKDLVCERGERTVDPDTFFADLDKSYLAEITDLIDPGIHHIRIGEYPSDMRVIVRVEYPAAGRQLRGHRP